MSTTNWESIVQRIRQHDQAAMVELYEHTNQKAYAMAMSMVKNPDDAFDVLQNAYIKAFNKIGTLNEPQKLESWLGKIVSNECKTFLRARKNVLFSELETEEQSFEDAIEDERIADLPEEQMDKAETTRLMGEILDKLPDEQRMVVMMFYFQELSIKEIAEVLECSENTVKSRLSYAKKKIKADVEMLEKEGTKLYGMAPLPLFLWFLKDGLAGAAVPAEFATALGQSVLSAAGGAAATVASTATTTATVAATAAKASVPFVAKIIAGVAAAAVVVTASIFGFVGLMTPDKVDPFEYIEPSYMGYDTQGVLIGGFDQAKSAIAKDILGEAPEDNSTFTDVNEETFEDRKNWEWKLYAYQQDIKITCSKEEGLSNGEEITITVTVMGEAADYVEAGSKVYVVEGLEPVEKIDPFEYLESEFSGMDGEAYVKLNRKDGEWHDAIYFKYANEDIVNGELSSGDTVIIKASFNEYGAEGYLAFERETMEITVPALDSWATPDDLPMDDIYQFAERFLKEQDEYYEDYDENKLNSYSTTKLTGIYFLQEREDAIAHNRNELRFVVETMHYVRGEYSKTNYDHLIFKDVIVNKDDKVILEYENGGGDGFFYTNIDNYLKDLEEDYLVTKIG